MKVLIIEDNAIKAHDIQRCLQAHYPDAEVDTAAAYATGVRKAYHGTYDVVVIDNSLPRHEDEPLNILPDMARMILEEFLDLEIAPKTVICSAYDPGEKEDYFQNIVSQYDCCIGSVRYDGSSSD